MIKFHKVSGKPGKVSAGEEHIWYSYPNGLYVADLQGNPRRITPGIRIGTEIPVGVPEEPGLFYYNSENKKNYISTADKWNEIGISSIPGSGGGSNIAGNVLVDDAANNFTSVDVEGVLAEIAEKFPWYFGKQALKDFTGDLSTLLVSNEKYVTDAATNKPATGWLSQRKASNGSTFGTLVTDEGNFFTRVNNTYTRMATSADLTNNAQSIIGSLGLEVGYGIKDNGKTLSTGLEVRLDEEIVQRLERVETGPDFVKIKGDTMTGPLIMRAGTGEQSRIQFNSNGSGNNITIMDDPKGGSVHNSTYGGKYGGPRFRIYDNKKGIDLLSYYTSDGSLDFSTSGPRFEIANKDSNGNMVIRNSGTSGIKLEATNSSNATSVRGKSGGFNFWTNAGSGLNEIHSLNASGKNKNLYIGGYGRADLGEIQLGASNVKAAGRMFTESSLNIGFQRDNIKRGGGGDACIRLFTNQFGLNGSGNDRKIYSVMWWDFKTRNFIFDAMESVGTGSTSRGPIYLNANGYITRSSIKYKNVKSTFDKSVLKTIKNTIPYTYSLKGDPKAEERLGFIIERGIPKEVVQNDGIDNYSLVTYLWKGVQELAAEVDELKNKLANV